MARGLLKLHVCNNRPKTGVSGLTQDVASSDCSAKLDAPVANSATAATAIGPLLLSLLAVNPITLLVFVAVVKLRRSDRLFCSRKHGDTGQSYVFRHGIAAIGTTRCAPNTNAVCTIRVDYLLNFWRV